MFIPSTVLGSKMSERLNENNKNVDEFGMTTELNNKMATFVGTYDAIRNLRLDGPTYNRVVQDLLEDNRDLIKEYEKQTNRSFSIPGIMNLYDEKAENMVADMQKETSQSIPKRKASFKDLTVNSYMRGRKNSEYGKELYKEMWGNPNNAEDYRQQLAGDEYNFETSNLLEKGISGAAQFLGQQSYNLTDPRTIGTMGTAVAGAAIAGNAGPQALFPEEALSLPTAAMIGYTAGSSANMFEIESGLAYEEMINCGIPPETARNVAIGVGGVNAALEAVQLDDLWKSCKILGANENTASAAKRLVRYLLTRTEHIAKETSQEVLQEANTIAATQGASMIENGEWAYSADEVTDRLTGVAEDSLATFAVIGGTGDAVNATLPTIHKKYSLAGENAETANSGMLKDAMMMHAEGVDAQTILQKTGWGMGSDGRWRFEIDNSEARLLETPELGEGERFYLLSEWFEHDRLYEAYPDLKYIRVAQMPEISDKSYCSPDGETIIINPDKCVTEDDKLNAVLEEIQNSIQIKEGFEEGASFEGTESYINSQKDNEEYEKYKSILGEENVPKTLEEFQEIKYNDGDEWKQLKLSYGTIREIDQKDWDYSFVTKAKSTYFQFKNEGIEMSAHAISRYLPRKEGKQGVTYTFEDIVKQSKMPVNYVQSDGRNVKYYNQVALVYNSEGNVIVSVVNRKYAKKDWRRK